MQRKIELRTMQNHYDLEDLTQECTAYMKTKQFMTSRIYQQQEEIELLRRGVLFHCSKHLELFPRIQALSREVSSLKEQVKSRLGSVNFSSEDDDITSSMECDDEDEDEDNPLIERIRIKKMDKQFENDGIINKDLIKENVQLKNEKEKLTQQIADKSLELSRARADKFILLNELNELTMSIKKCNLDEHRSAQAKFDEILCKKLSKRRNEFHENK